MTRIALGETTEERERGEIETEIPCCQPRMGHVLEKERKIESKTDQANTSLMIASCYGHIDIVSLQLSHGANIEVKGNHGFTTLIVASQKGY